MIEAIINNMDKFMKRCKCSFTLYGHLFGIVMLMVTSIIPLSVNAQEAGGISIIQGSVTSQGDNEPLTGAVVNELDATNRVVSAAPVDINGEASTVATPGTGATAGRQFTASMNG